MLYTDIIDHNCMHSCSTQFYGIIDHWMWAHSHVYFNNDHTVQKKINTYMQYICV